MSKRQLSQDLPGASPAAAPGPAGPAPGTGRAGGALRGPSGSGYGRPFRALTVATLACAYLLVVVGDTVRVTESGMGCRSWPLCNGQLGLTGNYHALLEQSHRYVAAALTVLVAASFAAALRRARGDRMVTRSAATALGLIGVQVLLGALTVFAHNAGWTVAAHLAGAWLVAGAVTLTAVGAWRPAPGAGGVPAPRVPLAGRLGVTAAVSLFTLAVSGMLVLHDGASTACPGWPACGLGGRPGLLALQYLHRSLALVTAVLVTAAAVRCLRARRARPAAGPLAVAVLVLLAGTVAAGGLVATTGAPPAGQDFHLAVGSALWIAVVALAGLPGSGLTAGRNAGQNAAGQNDAGQNAGGRAAAGRNAAAAGG